MLELNDVTLETVSGGGFFSMKNITVKNTNTATVKLYNFKAIFSEINVGVIQTIA